MKKKRHIKESVTLMVYRRTESQPFRWLLAVIIFALIMGVTFSEASGNERTEGTMNPVVHQTTIIQQQATATAFEVTLQHTRF